MELNKKDLRSKIRKLRQSLSAEFQINAAEQCSQIILASNILNNKQNIAFYISNDNELNLQPIIEYCLIHRKNCYLPVLNNQHLDFVKYTEHTKFKKNQYNIPEPLIKSKKDIISANDLDIVFLPLVAFNSAGQRLGMGGGFYDRSFAFLAHSDNNSNKPLLIGIAYDLQRVDNIPHEPWDIDIHGVATEKKFIKF